MRVHSRSTALAWSLLGSLSLHPGVTSAQGNPDEFRIGEFVGGQLSNAMQSLQAARRSKALAEQELAAARQQFWDTYPDGAGHAAAEAEFARRLASKDFYFLTIRNAQIVGRGNSIADVVEVLTGGELDGGVPVFAKPAFESWVAAVRASAPRTMGMPVITRETINAPESVEAYRVYKQYRDTEELLRGPRSPLASSDQRTYLTAILVRVVGLPGMAEGRAQYDALVAGLGAEAVREVEATLRQNLDLAKWTLPPAVGASVGLQTHAPNISARQYFMALTAHARSQASDGRRYVQLTLSETDTVPDWARGQRLYADLVRRHGEASVRSLGDRLRTGPQSFRCVPVPGHSSCLHALLASGDDAYLEALEAADSASRARAATAARARFANPDLEFLESREYWEWRADQQLRGQPRHAREEFIFTNRWRHTQRSYPVQALNVARGWLALGFQRRFSPEGPAQSEAESTWRGQSAAVLGGLRVQCARPTAEGEMSIGCRLERLAKESLDVLNQLRADTTGREQ